MQPIVRAVNGAPEHRQWGRHCTSVDYFTDGEEFVLSFTYQLTAKHTEATEVFFAFCYPFSYAENQAMLSELDARYSREQWGIPSSDEEVAVTRADSMGEPKGPVGANSLYYHRELLVSSIEGLRVDLITITSCHGRL